MVPDEKGSDSLELNEQRRRLETLGRLAGNVIHDFNNLLMVIDGYARMMLEESALSRTARESAHEILNASERAAALTRQLLAFSRKKTLDSGPIDLNAQITAMRPMLKRLLGETVMLECELAGKPAVIQANLSRVEQVLLNLIVNARDAMPVGGRIVVRTRSEASMVVVEVEDTGLGIPAGMEGRIFEPFFTTKDAGKGTGIGLALVAETLNDWGGVVEVASSEGHGAKFTLRIPELDQGELPVQSGQTRSTILVVEDEEGVRTLIRRILEQRSYQVLEASSESEAAEQASASSQIDLLITDMEIKGGQGRVVAILEASASPDQNSIHFGLSTGNA